MGAQVMGDFFKNEEEKQELQRIEQLKRLDRKFIRVRYLGDGKYPRIHGSFGVEAYRFTEPDGTATWKTAEKSTVLNFVGDSLGNLTGEVLDCEYNRFWLSRHLPPTGEIDIDDPATKREIEALKNVEFKVEVPRIEQLHRDRERVDREIAAEEASVERTEEPAQEVAEPPAAEAPVVAKTDEPPVAVEPQEPPKRRGRPPGSKNKPKAKRKALSDKLNDKV